MTRKSLLLTWSKLYKVFARCSALVPTAEENICCEELCARMAAVVNAEALTVSIVGGANEELRSDAYVQGDWLVVILGCLSGPLCLGCGLQYSPGHGGLC